MLVFMKIAAVTEIGRFVNEKFEKTVDALSGTVDISETMMTSGVIIES